LWHLRVSHYNEKVRWALDHKGWPHVRRALIPGLHVPRVRWLTGQNKVPVLSLDGKAVHDSTAILAEIQRRCPYRPLLPDDPALRARALAIEEHYDEDVAPEMRRLFWSAYWSEPAHAARMAADGFGGLARVVWRVLFPALRPVFAGNLRMDPESLARARARVDEHFDRLEASIGPSGFLVGDRFGHADLCAAAVMTALIRPPEFPYPLPEPWPPALVELRERYASRAGFRWVLDIYARHRGTSAEVAG
jgi:glutathione S-transferase